MNGESALAVAASEQATVTVTRGDGRVATGILKPHPTEPGTYSVQTGRRGRPVIVHEDDVEEVSYE